MNGRATQPAQARRSSGTRAARRIAGALAPPDMCSDSIDFRLRAHAGAPGIRRQNCDNRGWLTPEGLCQAVARGVTGPGKAVRCREGSADAASTAG